MSGDPAAMLAAVRPPLRKVLIVDDAPSMREVVAFRIEEQGRYLVLQAEGPQDALETVDQNPDILAVFVDQRFGNDERGGLKILRDILRQRPLLPVILYTAAPVADIRREAYDAGALWYLSKVQIAGPEDLIALLEIASKLVDVMPVDTDPRFLKQVLDAVPTEVMVRDSEGHVVYQNKAKEAHYGPIVPGRTFCWSQYESQRDDPNDRCPGAEENCACELVFSPRSQEDSVWPVKRIHRYHAGWSRARRDHQPGWWDIAATGILGRDGKPQYVVEVGREVTQLVETLQLITDIANQYDLSELESLQLASARLVDRVGFARARVWEFDPKTRSFVCRAAAGPHEGEVIGRRVTWSEGQLARLAQLKPMQVSKEELAVVISPALHSDIAPADEYLWAPFSVGGELAGLLVVDRKGQEPEHISQVDEYWMGFLAQQLSAVVEIKRRRQDLEWLEELDRKISGVDTIAGVLRIVIDSLQERVSADLIQFHQLSADGKTIRLAADNRQHRKDCPARKGYPATVGANARACRLDEPVFLDTTAQDEDFLRYRQELGPEWGKGCPGCEVLPVSMACIPIHMGDKVVGSLCLVYKESHVFSAREQDLLKRVCDSLSIALKATQRLSVVQSQAMEVRRVAGIQIIARGLTHALRNIGQVIMGYSGGIERMAAERERVREGAQAISSQGHAMHLLFDALGRHAAEQPTALKTPIHQAIVDLVTLQKRRFLDHGVAFDVNLDRACDGVRKDQDKFLVILLTVVENAFRAVTERAGPGPRTVEIRTAPSEDGTRVSVAVQDTGVGIAPDRLNTMLDWPAVDVWGMPPSHGIGLPIARSLAQSLGGDIRIQSQPGVGTIVTIDLPAAEDSHD